ncbi:MAG: hypothetical protein JOZ60_11130 [Verrucomicrobia bacterium]|nr:hypothetical protein [Verrucomicrobiota bacterium]
MKTLIYSVILFAVCAPWSVASGQSTLSSAEQPTAAQVGPPLQTKKTGNPESIKRAKLTRLRKDVALTDEQVEKVKPIIDVYVNEMEVIKSDASLDSHTKRQKFSEARQKYDSALDGILDAEQQRKLASIQEERRARLRAARAGKVSTTLQPTGSAAVPATVQ